MRILLFVALTLAFIGCSEEKLEKNILKGPAFGTTYNISYYSSVDTDFQTGIDSVINVVNQSVSTYLPGSAISRINDGDATVVVDDIFRNVYMISEEVYKRSDGYFDPTIGVLRNAYGFGTEEPLQQLDSTVIDSLRMYVGFEKVTLTKDNRIKKLHPQIYFDFNAVAKGYGIDRIGEYLEAKGIENYLVELGGEVIAKGMNIEKEKSWVVGIEATTSQTNDRQFEEIVKLSNMAMASSGNYRKFRVDSLTGKRYVHTINPLNGQAEASDVTSATVFAATCAEADAYATTFMAMGLERSKALLEELNGIEAYLTYQFGSETRSYNTPGFDLLKTD